MAQLFEPPADLIEAIIRVESGGNPEAVSPSGAIGLMQILPSTAQNPGGTTQPVDPATLTDPRTNVEFGINYFKDRLREYDGDVVKALQAYHAGSGNLNAFLSGESSDFGAASRAYAGKVLSRVPQYVGASEYQTLEQFGAFEEVDRSLFDLEGAGRVLNAGIPDRETASREEIETFIRTASREQVEQFLGQSVESFIAPPAAAERPSVLGELGVGAVEGVTQNIPNAAKFIYGTALQTLGDEAGAQEIFAATDALAEEQAKTNAPRVLWEDIESIEDVLRWGLRGTGESVPYLAAAVLAAAGAKVAALGGLAAVGAGAAATATGAKVGGVLGGVLAMSALEGGFNAMEQFERTGEVDPAVVAVVGALNGALEAAVPLKIASRFGISTELAEGLLKSIDKALRGSGIMKWGLRRLKSVGEIGALEGFTEAAQETVQAAAIAYVDDNSEFFSEETAARVTEAAALGFFAGGLFGAVTPSRKEGTAEGSDIPVGEDQLRDLFGVSQPQPTPPEVFAEPPTVVELPAGTLGEALKYAENPEPLLPFELPYQIHYPSNFNPTGITPADPDTQKITLPSDQLSLGLQYIPTHMVGFAPKGVEGVPFQFMQVDEGETELGLLDTRGEETVDAYQVDLGMIAPWQQTSALRDLRFIREDALEGRVRRWTGERWESLDPAGADFVELGKIHKDLQARYSGTLTESPRLISLEDVRDLQQRYDKLLEKGLRVAPERFDARQFIGDVPAEAFIRLDSTFAIPQRNLDSKLRVNLTPDGSVTVYDNTWKFAGDSEQRRFALDWNHVRPGELIKDPMTELRWAFPQKIFQDVDIEEITPEIVKDLRLLFDVKMPIEQLTERVKMFAAANISFRKDPSTGVETSYYSYTTNLENMQLARDFIKATGFNVNSKPGEVGVWMAEGPGTHRAFVEIPQSPVNERARGPSKYFRGGGERRRTDSALDKHIKASHQHYGEDLKKVKRGKKSAFDFTPHDLPEFSLAASTRVLDKLSSKEKRNLNRGLNLLKTLRSRFAKDMKIVALIDPKDSDMDNNLGWADYSSYVDGNHKVVGVAFIYLNVGESVPYIGWDGTILTERRSSDFFNTVAHEFGHALTYDQFGNLSSAMQERIIRTYERTLRALVKGDPKSYARRRQSPSFRHWRNVHNEQMVRYREGLADDYNYWFNLNEWFAEQFARYVWADNTKFANNPFSSVEFWFRRVADRLKRMFNFANKHGERLIEDFEQLRPEAAMQLWFDTASETAGFPQSEIDPTNPGLETVPRVAMSVEAIPSAMASRAEVETFSTVRSVPSQAGTIEANRVIDKILFKKEDGVDTVKLKSTNDTFNFMYRIFGSILHLADANLEHIPLQKYVGRVRQWYQEKMAWITRANNTLSAWKLLSQEESDNLSAFLYHINEMDHVPQGEELVALGREFNLTKAASDFYTDFLKKDFLDFLNAQEQVILDEIASDFKDRPMSDKAVWSEFQKRNNEVRQEFERLRSKPYFPASRFGKYFIRANDESGEIIYFEQFEEARLRDQHIKALRNKQLNGQADDLLDSKGNPLKLTPGKIVEENFALGMGMTPRLIGLIEKRMEKILGELKPSQKQAFRDWAFKMAPSQSFVKHRMQRKGIAGFSRDTKRAYASYFFHGANHLARIKHQPALEEAVSEAAALAREQLDLVKTDKRTDIVNYMQRHLKYILHPPNEWTGLRAVAFQWWLGAVPASAFLNLTQVPMVALPYLSSKFGEVQTIGALKNGALQVRKMYINSDKLPPNLLRAIAEGIRQGFIDESQSTEIAGVAEGMGLIQNLGTKGERMAKTAAHVSGFLFHHSERINRFTVFNAAYNLALKNPDAKHLEFLKKRHPEEYSRLSLAWDSNQEALAFLAGRDAVDQTQFEYATWARPEFMRGPLGTIFVFWMFKTNMLWYLFGGQNRGAAARTLVLMLFASGLMGLPGADDMEELARFFARSLFGKDFNLEAELRDFALTLGVEQPEWIMHGIGRNSFGIPMVADAVGIPFPSIDMSRAMGLGPIIPGLPALNAGSFDRGVSELTQAAAGGALAPFFGVAQMLSDDHPDFRKRWERAVPRSIKSVWRAIDYAIRGGEFARTPVNTKIVDFDLNDGEHIAELVLQAGGFTPTRLSREWDQTRFAAETGNYWASRRAILLTYLDYAVSSRDHAQKRDIIASIRKFNSDVPFAPFKISTDTVLRSLTQRAQGRQQAEAGFGTDRMDIGPSRLARELFPEAEIDDSR